MVQLLGRAYCFDAEWSPSTRLLTEHLKCARTFNFQQFGQWLIRINYQFHLGYTSLIATCSALLFILRHCCSAVCN